MLNTNRVNIDYRALSMLITNGGFKKLNNEDCYKSYIKHLKKILEKGGVNIENEKSIKELLDKTYSLLTESYRHEYIYKSSILTDYIFLKYKLENSIMLNEFKIGKSIADIVLVNGTNKVFEIKTELDTAERLKTQIDDYYKAFSEVSIVTHISLKEKYSKLLNNHIGIICYKDDNTLITYRKSTKMTNNLNIETMFKSLRKGEYLNVLKRLFGELPRTNDFDLFKESLNLANQVSPITFQKEFLNELKQREKSKLAPFQEMPNYLKFFCYNSNIKEKEYLGLVNRLTFTA